MGYPHRIQLPDKTYLVESRCHNLQELMNPEKMKDLLEDVIIMTQKKYNFELNYYEILDDEFYFIIKTLPGEAEISKIMQFIKSRYALAFNRLNDRTGAFWNERYKDTIIEDEENPELFFLWLLWYLAYLPVRSNKVSDPRRYKHHTIHMPLHIEPKSRVKITFHRYYLDLGKTNNERIKKFLQFEDIYRKRISLCIFQN